VQFPQDMDFCFFIGWAADLSYWKTGKSHRTATDCAPSTVRMDCKYTHNFPFTTRIVLLVAAKS
jgi:hypothetical protein